MSPQVMTPSSPDDHERRTHTAPSALGAALVMLFGGAMSAFFLGLMAAVLLSPMQGSAVVVACLRVFVVLMFGGITIAGLLPTFDQIALMGLRRHLRRLPPVCLGCGRDAEARARACSRCGFDATSARRWATPAARAADGAIALGIFGGIAALGAALGAHALEATTPWGVLMSGPLALLLGAVGLLGVLGLGGEARRGQRHDVTWVHEATWGEPCARNSARVTATRRRGVVELRGVSRLVVDAVEPVDAALASRFERGLAAALAAAMERGEVRLRHEVVVSWSRSSAARPSSPSSAHTYRGHLDGGDDDGRGRVEEGATWCVEWCVEWSSARAGEGLSVLGLGEAVQPPGERGGDDAADIGRTPGSSPREALADLVALAWGEGREALEASDPGPGAFARHESGVALAAVVWSNQRCVGSIDA